MVIVDKLPALDPEGSQPSVHVLDASSRLRLGLATSPGRQLACIPIPGPQQLNLRAGKSVFQYCIHWKIPRIANCFIDSFDFGHGAKVSYLLEWQFSPWLFEPRSPTALTN